MNLRLMSTWRSVQSDVYALNQFYSGEISLNELKSLIETHNQIRINCAEKDFYDWVSSLGYGR